MCRHVLFAGWRGVAVAVLCAVAASGSAAAPADGFLYGTVATRSGNAYTGVIRWGDEEAFWDDIFHSGKEDLPFAEYSRAQRDEAADRWWKVLGGKIEDALGVEPITRTFAGRFGDIERIEVTGRSEARVTMKSGTSYRVSGYANDVGSPVTVDDVEAGEVKIAWKNIETIVFSRTPSDLRPEVTRLFGTVSTVAGDFTGFIQWDEDECLSSDVLDGDTDDGRMSLAMGSLASIEKASLDSVRVTLNDGRELELDGTNDVDSSIRGIFIEDPRFGRVRVSWKAFRRIDLQTPDGSGRGYDRFGKPWRLRGTVVDRSGTRHTGSIVYDLDETESWELFNGGHDGVSYLIPFARLVSLDARDGSTVVVTLEDGEELRLDEGQDASAKNAGVVVIPALGAEVFVRWDDVKRIEFARSASDDAASGH